MNYTIVIFTVLFTGILIFGGSNLVYGAQLNAVINPNSMTSDFDIKYLKTVQIYYTETSKIAEFLSDKSWNFTITASTPDPDAVALMDALNQKIALDGSRAQISELDISYLATLTGRDSSTSIDYAIVFTGVLSNYNIASTGSISSEILVDLGWRGLSVNSPIMIDGIEINMPISILKINEPDLYSYIKDTVATKLLKEPLINAEGILNQPLSNWHFLFDPTGISVDAGTFGLADDIKGFVLSSYTMGESSIREGRQIEKEIYEEFTLDATYGMRTLQSADSATLRIIGYTQIDNIDVEIVRVTSERPVSQALPEFSVGIIYGMAGMAVIGGIAFFIFSNRQLKKDVNQGQTGIDPSRLTGYQTSVSAGGYRTNRVEAQLTDATDYAQTRSMYDDSSNTQQNNTSAVESSATCGCSTSIESGNECDCQMQDQCFCDATCDCNSNICKDAVKEMQ